MMKYFLFLLLLFSAKEYIKNNVSRDCPIAKFKNFQN